MRIYNRFRPCNCGCKGTDPWHRSTYDRKLKMIDEETATCRLPMSTKPVIVRKKIIKCGNISWDIWVVDRDSIVFDR